MKHYCILLGLLLTVFTNGLHAQQVTGKIYSTKTDSVIAASVYNKNIGKLVASENGSYSIRAKEADTLIVSAIGFIPDTLIVSYYMLYTNLDVMLAQESITLQTVKVISSYQLDSFNRRDEYNYIFKKQPGITGNNRPADGIGISLSPVSYFSNQAKQKRLLKKKLLKAEHETFIDFCFRENWVQQLTGLQPDSLRSFMYSYRPSYDFCRKTDRTGMVIYINDKLTEFRKPGSHN